MGAVFGRLSSYFEGSTRKASCISSCADIYLHTFSIMLDKKHARLQVHQSDKYGSSPVHKRTLYNWTTWILQFFQKPSQYLGSLLGLEYILGLYRCNLWVLLPNLFVANIQGDAATELWSSQENDPQINTDRLVLLPQPLHYYLPVNLRPNHTNFFREN